MKQVRVGVGVLIYNGSNQILLGKRKGGHAPGVYATPGGHQEFGETWAQCAYREILEECGNDLVINGMKFFHAVDAYYKEEEKHYTTIFMECRARYGQAKNMEPDKSEGWNWYSVANLPQPLMLSIELLIREKSLWIN